MEQKPHTGESSFHKTRFAQQDGAETWHRGAEKDCAPGGERFEVIFPMLRKWVKDHPSISQLCDIGSGDGSTIQAVPEHVRYVGIEPSSVLRDYAERSLQSRRNTSVLSGSAEKTGLETGSVDGALSSMVWQHVGRIDIAALEMARILRTGGQFCIIVPNVGNQALWLSFFETHRILGNRIEVESKTEGGIKRDHFYWHTEQEITSACADAGLVVISITDLGHSNPKLFSVITGTKVPLSK